MHTHPDLEWLNAQLALIDALSAELADIKRLLAERRAFEAKYNPRWRKQPRAPSGRPDGGQWVDGGGGGGGAPKNTGGARPPPRPPPRPGHNQPPANAEPAPLRPHLNWRNMSDREYFEALGALSQQRRSEERVAALQDAIRSLDPNYRFNPIVTRRSVTFESYLREQLHVLRIQNYGPLGMERVQWTRFRQEVTLVFGARATPARKLICAAARFPVFRFAGARSLKGPRDFDVATVSPTLFEAARRSGVEIRGASRTAPLTTRQLARLGIPGLSRRENGRRVTYVIFNSPGVTYGRPGPAVPLAYPSN